MLRRYAAGISTVILLFAPGCSTSDTGSPRSSTNADRAAKPTSDLQTVRIHIDEFDPSNRGGECEN